MHLKKISFCDDNLVFLRITGYIVKLFRNKNYDEKCLYKKCMFESLQITEFIFLPSQLQNATESETLYISSLHELDRS